ncbi:hypothetical protein TNCV_2631121 [Trichonephila clavipes]|nr:hypothetical protein TNCV_2631121 [Trichonephila clavipes]
MILKFEETGTLNVLPGRGRKPVGTETATEVTTAMVETASSSIYSSASVHKCHASWRSRGRQNEKFCDIF